MSTWPPGLPVVATPLPALADVEEVTRAADADGDRGAARAGARRRQPRAPRVSARGRRRRIPGSGAWRRSRRRSTRCEGPARHHAHARAAQRPGGAHLRRRARAGEPPRARSAVRPLRRRASPTRAFRAIPGIALHEAVPSRGARRAARLRAARACAACPAASRAASHPSWRRRRRRARRRRDSAGA